MNRIIIYFCFFISIYLSISSNISAQNNYILIGKIVDSTNNQAICYATIKVLNSKQSTISNSKGIFNINQIELNNCAIEVSNVGYSTQIIKISSTRISDTLIVKLKEQFLNVEEVVVTATRTEKMLKDVPVLTQVIPSTQIKNSSVTNITDILNTLKPGVDFYNEGRGMTFRMQGLAAKYTLFLIDGERFSGENRDNIDYSRLSSSNIDHIEIVQGASSSLYGSNAIGGVVNLITRTPVNPFEANIYSRFSKFKEMENGVNIGVKSKKISYFIDGVRKQSDGYDNSHNTSDLYTVEPFKSYSVFNKLIYDISDKIQISARASYFTRERFDVSTVPIHPFYTDLATGLNAKFKQSEKLNFTGSIYRDMYKSYEVYERLNDSLGKIYSNAQLSSKLISNFKINLPKYNLNQQASVGVEYFSDEVFAERIEDTTKSNQNYTVFIQDEVLIKNNINITLGARNDFHSEYGNSISPKIALMYKHKKMNYRLAYAQGFRSPSIKERYYDFDLGFVMVKGNKDLIPEKSYYKSISAEYMTSNSNISLNLYHNYLKNMILEQPIAGVYNGYTYKNFNDVEITGSDLLMRVKLFNLFSLTSGYSFTYALDKKTNELLSGVSKHSATIGIDYFLRIKSHIFGIVCSGKIYGKKDFVNLSETGELYDDVFPTYSLWKASIISKFLNEALLLNIGIDNIFNYKTTGDLINTDPGRRLFITISISCDKLYKKFKIN